MRKGFAIRVALLAAFIMFTHQAARAGDISWSGDYRVEAVKTNNAELDNIRRRKAYLLQHLVLQPKLVAADGLNIYGRFDVLNGNNSSVYGTNSVAGQTFGSGPNSSNTAAASGSGTGDSNVFANSEKSDALMVTEVYATWVNEFGTLVVGRAPLQFGLGMTYDAGNGLFDHFLTTRDMVGYKAVFGNLYVMPILGKVNEGQIALEDDVNDYILHVQYDNPESNLSLGAFYQLRVAAHAGNDAPSGVAGNTGASTAPNDGFKSQSINLFVSEKVHDVNVGVEAGFVTGTTGVTNVSGSEAKINAYGVAGELGYNRPDSKWAMLLKAGLASGDDPGTADDYEGFTFNQNYNIGMLLFNHPLGQRDFLRTYAVRNTTTTASSQTDTETVSNALYVAPNLTFKWRDNMSFGGTFVWATLQRDPLGTGTAKDLGYELDFNFTYKPYERLTWITEVGMLEAGDAFRGGSLNLDNHFCYGMQTKAAISF